MRIYTIIFLTILAVISCTNSGSDDWTETEAELIRGADSIMRVLTIEDSLDNAVLRASSKDFSATALLSSDFRRLSDLMVKTVTHPSQDGVGIAGPQVGLNRRVVAVQRFDKQGEPFEVYPNIRIVWASDSLAPGPEGCLSVPDRRGEVLRSQEIVIEYADLQALSDAGAEGCWRSKNTVDAKEAGSERCSKEGRSARGDRREVEERVKTEERDESIPMVRDTVKGFTAVIFQHEIDHLDGILYIDRL